VLQTRSDKEAGEVFRRIRRGTDAGSILRHVNYGDVLVQLALKPEARYRYEFPYLPDMPPFLRQLDNPYLDSEVYEYALRGAPDPSQHPGHQQQHKRGLLADTGSSTDSVYGAGQRDPYLKPYLSATVVNPCLDSVKPSNWTTVSDDDCLMRKLLHDYFLFEYDWFTFFHKDYFVEDMGSGNRRFCSPLLVNAVLCIGCVSFHCFPACPFVANFPSIATAVSRGVPSFGIPGAWGTDSWLKPGGFSRLNRNLRGRSETPLTRTGSAETGSGSRAGLPQFKLHSI
jgi:hypothetical protein